VKTIVERSKYDAETLEKLITKYAGLAFSNSRANSMQHAVSALLKDKTELAPEQLSGELQSDSKLIYELTEHMLVHETYFLREEERMDLLMARVNQNYNGGKTFRIWSAGCSTGEEPYSLAIRLSNTTVRNNFKVIGTDISERSLATARNAIYSEWSLRTTNTQMRTQHFTRIDARNYRFSNRELIEKVTFAQANLLTEKPLPADWYPLDAIVCRNVLIYFDTPSIAAVARIFFDSLADGAYLLTGASDPPLSSHAPFQTESTAHGTIYRKPMPTNRAAPPVPSRPVRPTPSRPTPSAVDPRPNAGAASTAGASRTSPAAKPTTDETRSTRAMTAYRSGNYSEVLELLESSFEADLQLYVKSLLNLGRAREAVEAAEKVSTENPLEAGAHLACALALMDMQKHAPALEKLQRAIFLERDFVFAHYLSGIAYFAGGEQERAVKSLKKASTLLQKLPDNSPVKCAEDETREHLLKDINRYVTIIESRKQN